MDVSDPQVWTGFLVFLISLFLASKFIDRVILGKKLPPGPVGLPLVGYLPFLKHALNMRCQDLSKTYGKIFSVYLGRHLVVVITDYKILQEAFMKKADIFSYRPVSLPFRVFPNLNGIVTAEGPEFRVYKSFVTSALKDAGALKSSLEIIVGENAARFTSNLEQTVGKPVNVLEDVGLSVAQTYSRLFFCRTFSHESAWFRTLVRLNYDQQRLYDNGARLFLDPWIKKLPVFSTFWGDHKIKKVTVEILAHFELQLKILRDSYFEGSRDNFVHAWITENLSRKKNNPNDNLFTWENLVHNVNIIYGAGYETTTTGIRWSIILLMDKPELQSKLQREIDEIIGDERNPSMADESRMPYTQSFIQEMHRYTTIGPLGVQHRNNVDTYLGGFFIPKDSYVIANQLGINMDADNFHEPHVFKPDRFIRADGTFERPSEVVAFSLGRRSCPGESLAQCEIFLYVTYILQKFNMINPDNQKLPDPLDSFRSGSLSSEPDEFRVTFVPRKQIYI